MRFLFFLVPVILIFLNQACKSNSSNKSDKDPLYLEVMAIHDAVMPEMATIHTIIRSLKSITPQSESESIQIRDQIQMLDLADENMMVWMADLRLPEDPDDHKKYLAEEKIKIQKVSDDMYEAIRSGQDLLSKLKSQ